MSWRRSIKEWKGLRQICREKILDDVLKSLTAEDEWLILILDKMAMKLITACFKTEEILAQKIALIEMLEENREPLNYLSAVYILSPSEKSIHLLLKELDSKLYKKVHLAFLSTVPDDLFNTLVTSINPLLVMTFLELDMLFLPWESQVFSLNDDSFFTQYFNSYLDVSLADFKNMAKKIATLFSTLGEVPLIRYRKDFIKNFILAETIQREIDLIKHSFSQSKQSKAQNRCQLLILDRGFDCVSPLLHEFTFQAMIYDLLNIKDDSYDYTLTQGDTLSVALTEEDRLWTQLRHEHIANVSKIIQNKIETDTLMEKTSFIRKKGLPGLSETIKQFILSKRNESFYSYRFIANECMKLYCAGINVISQLEQNLAMGTTIEGYPTKNPLENVMTILSDDNYEMNQKLRILLLYIFFVKGISKKAFDDIIYRADMTLSSTYMITNVLHLDVDIFRPGKCIPVQETCVERSEEFVSEYKQSRWKPLIKDIILSCVKGNLSEDHFPTLNAFDNQELIPIQRPGYWCADKKNENASQLVIFIAGGVTYSEMCCTYEVMKKYTGWDIFIGGDSLLTPKKFIEKLAELPSLLSEDL